MFTQNDFFLKQRKYRPAIDTPCTQNVFSIQNAFSVPDINKGLLVPAHPVLEDINTQLRFEAGKKKISKRQRPSTLSLGVQLGLQAQTSRGLCCDVLGFREHHNLVYLLKNITTQYIYSRTSQPSTFTQEHHKHGVIVGVLVKRQRSSTFTQEHHNMEYF